MKLTKFAILALFTLNSVNAADAKPAKPFADQDKVIKLANKIYADTVRHATQTESMKKSEAEVKTLEDKYADTAEQLDTDCAAGSKNIKVVSSSVTLGDDDPEADKKAAEELKKKCEEYAKDKATRDEAAKKVDSVKKIVDGIEIKLDLDKKNLAKMNPGFTGYAAEIKGSVTAGSAFVFLTPEVDETTKQGQFLGKDYEDISFNKKVADNLKAWTDTRKAEDATKAAEKTDEGKLYAEVVKADDMAIKAYTDFQKKLTEVGKGAWTDKGEMAAAQVATFKVAVAQYQLDAIKSNIAQALALKPLESDKAVQAKYDAYVTEMKKISESSKKALEAGGSDGGNGLMIAGIVGVVVCAAAAAAYKFCSPKKDEE